MSDNARENRQSDRAEEHSRFFLRPPLNDFLAKVLALHGREQFRIQFNKGLKVALNFIRIVGNSVVREAGTCRLGQLGAAFAADNVADRDFDHVIKVRDRR